VFRDALEKRQDISFKTQQKHLDALHRLYRVGTSKGLVEANPATDVKISKPSGLKFADEESGKTFSTKQVRMIFAATED